MAGFDAATVVEPLKYSFEPFVKLSGIVREPTDRQIADYMTGIKTVVRSLQEKLPETLTEGGDVVLIMSALDDLDPEDVVQFHLDMAGIFGALCSGDPSKEKILELPPRIRVLFYAWLQQEVMAPEAVTGAGSERTTLRAVAG